MDAVLKVKYQAKRISAKLNQLLISACHLIAFRAAFHFTQRVFHGATGSYLIATLIYKEDRRYTPVANRSIYVVLVGARFI